MPKYGPFDPDFDWVGSQAPRHKAASEHYGGTWATGTSMRAHSLFQPLYTARGAKEAVDHAVQTAEEWEARVNAGGAPSPPKPGDDDDDYDQGDDWLETGGISRTHAEANFLQLRLSAQILTRFQPFRHTIIIAGRPMQAVMCFLWSFHID